MNLILAHRSSIIQDQHLYCFKINDIIIKLMKVKKLPVFFLFLLIAIFLLVFYLNKGDGFGIKNTQSLKQSETETYVSPISIDYLRTLKIVSEPLKIEEELQNGSNYKRYIA